MTFLSVHLIPKQGPGSETPFPTREDRSFLGEESVRRQISKSLTDQRGSGQDQQSLVPYEIRVT